MPETSQDNFEVLNPVNSPFTPEYLRARANSIGNTNSTSSSCGSATGAVRKQKKVSISGLPPISPDEEFRGRSYTASDMDHSIINGVGDDQYKGYKREIDHRYGISWYDEIDDEAFYFIQNANAFFFHWGNGSRNRLASSFLLWLCCDLNSKFLVSVVVYSVFESERVRAMEIQPSHCYHLGAM